MSGPSSPFLPAGGNKMIEASANDRRKRRPQVKGSKPTPVSGHGVNGSAAPGRGGGTGSRRGRARPLVAVMITIGAAFDGLGLGSPGR